MERFQIVGVGYSCVDSVCMVEDYPVEDSSTHVTKRILQGGGAVATALVAASRLGSSCAFIGNLGNDSVSDDIIRMFKSEGVCTDHMIRRDDCQGLESIIMVNPENGSRTKFPQRDFSPAVQWNQKLKDVIKNSMVLHLDGTHYENALNAARIAKEYGVLVSLDGCSMQKDNEKNKALATLADILIMNSKYPLRVSGKSNYNETLLEMSSWGSKKVIGCTLGEYGSKFVIDGKVVDFPSFKATKVLDTTGCGDVFHGAFLSAFTSGMDLKRCIIFASATACIKCAFPGGRAGIPDRKTVLDMIGE
ncbi:MAG: carbohydrate kinase family protein [Spirochaetales bacterium]|nr:carbohydrate kinase family protein [Spirochaetales bacterium]